MSLRAALADLAGRDPESGLPPLPGRPVLAEAADELESRRRSGETPPPPDRLAEAGERILRTLRGKKRRLARRADWRLLPWCLWRGPTPVAADSGLLLAALERYRTTVRGRDLRRLITAYLSDFETGAPGLGNVASLILVASVAAAGDPPTDGWMARHRRYGLFNPNEAPRRLAAACLADGPGPAAVLADAGLEGPLAEGGMARAAFLAALSLAEAAPDDLALAERLDAWGNDAGGYALVPEGRERLSALLMPVAEE